MNACDAAEGVKNWMNACDAAEGVKN